MPSEYLASTLIDAIRDEGMLPPAGNRASTARLFGFMNREQRGYLMRLILSARESYRVASTDVAITIGKTVFAIPSRAVGAKLKLVEVLNSQGEPVPLNPIKQEQNFANSVYSGAGDFYLKDNSIVLVKSPLVTGTLRLTYYRRFNKIVPAEEAGEVASFNSGAKTVTLTAVPVLFTGSKAYDIIQGSPHFDSLAVSEVASIAGSVLTFTNAIPTDLAAGDYVALAGQTPIAQAPVELQDVLTLRTVAMYLLSVGDPKAAAAAEMLKELRENMVPLIAPRVDASDEVLINYNAPGWNRFRNRRRRYS